LTGKCEIRTTRCLLTTHLLAYLDRVDVDAVAQLGGEITAAHPRTDHHAVVVQRLALALTW
jgi:hypothetical protein